MLLNLGRFDDAIEFLSTPAFASKASLERAYLLPCLYKLGRLGEASAAAGERG